MIDLRDELYRKDEYVIFIHVYPHGKNACTAYYEHLYVRRECPIERYREAYKYPNEKVIGPVRTLVADVPEEGNCFNKIDGAFAYLW